MSLIPTCTFMLFSHPSPALLFNTSFSISPQGKVLRYFPTERGQQVSQGPITLSLTTQKTTPTHVERMISLQYRDQSLKRTVVHLQFTSWPELYVFSFN